MQNAFLERAGTFDRLGSDMESLRRGVPAGARALTAARNRGLPIIHLRMAFRPNYADVGLFRDLSPGVLALEGLKDGSWDVAPAPGFAPHADEPTVLKNRYSGFHATDLHNILAAHRITKVTLFGVLTNSCVESTARDAMQRDIPVQIIADACGALDEASHGQALLDMSRAVGRVISTEEFIATL